MKDWSDTQLVTHSNEPVWARLGEGKVRLYSRFEIEWRRFVEATVGSRPMTFYSMSNRSTSSVSTT
jgi:hypothetical protein